MNCEKIREIFLFDYIDGDISDEMKKGVESHLSICDECKNVYENLISIRSLAEKIRTLEPSARVWRNVEREITKENFRKAGLFHRTYRIAAVLALVIFILGGVIFIKYRSEKKEKLLAEYIKEKIEFIASLDDEPEDIFSLLYEGD